MTNIVKPRRQYDSRRRREQAAQTRRDIEAAADKLFRERGYVGTSMPAIAAETGVVVETIYRAFGSKAALFKAVIESALAGGSQRADTPPAERPAIRAVIDETDPHRKLELYAATQPGVHGRSGPLFRVLVAAADSDPELRDVLDAMEARRLHGCMGWANWLRSSRKAAPCVQICQSRRRGTSSGPFARRPFTTYSFDSAAGRRRLTKTGLRLLCGANCSRSALDSLRSCRQFRARLPGPRVGGTGVRF
jgi:AcrR family transcriptional regulator